MKNFNRNLKAISPIFATLILIAIAVIAGVVVYMFTSGTLATMTGGGTAGQEKVSVQGVQYTSSATSISVYAQNTGTGTVTVNGMIIKNSAGNTVQTATVLTNTALTGGNLITVGGTITALAPGSYTVTLTTVAGGSFVSSSFVVS
jgi:archaeal type IV pilus assembly protein PilA